MVGFRSGSGCKRRFAPLALAHVQEARCASVLAKHHFRIDPNRNPTIAVRCTKRIERAGSSVETAKTSRIDGELRDLPNRHSRLRGNDGESICPGIVTPRTRQEKSFAELPGAPYTLRRMRISLPGLK